MIEFIAGIVTTVIVLRKWESVGSYINTRIDLVKNKIKKVFAPQYHIVKFANNQYGIEKTQLFSKEYLDIFYYEKIDNINNPAIWESVNTANFVKGRCAIDTYAEAQQYLNKLKKNLVKVEVVLRVKE